ncbi:MAG: translation initiation factor IF-3 [Bacteroidetes bacterium]|nr:translation initiation factor IF-3 [Bacteroidota bacterium]
MNEKIRASTVRLVGEGVEAGVYSIEDALKISKQLGEDLVEISPKANPPVCKVINYSKFRYQQKKKEKEIKSKTQKTVIKEIRFSPNTDGHDFDFKVRHAIKFLKDGAKLKALLRFSGREVMFKDRGEVMLLKFAQALEDYGKVEQMPKLEGKRMTLLISPKTKKQS